MLRRLTDGQFSSSVKSRLFLTETKKKYNFKKKHTHTSKSRKKKAIMAREVTPQHVKTGKLSVLFCDVLPSNRLLRTYLYWLQCCQPVDRHKLGRFSLFISPWQPSNLNMLEEASIYNLIPTEEEKKIKQARYDYLFWLS